MASYQHSQSQPAIAALVLVVSVIILIPAITSGEPVEFIVPAFIAFAAVIVFAMSKLTTTVTPTHIEATFRWGWPRRSIPLTEVARAETSRNKWWFGFGVRVVPNSTTMYNVWGLDAVHLDLRGVRNFRIGTNDPQGLLTAITHELNN